MKSLNGWKRLWLLCAIGWGLVVGAVSATTWPSHTDYSESYVAPPPRRSLEVSVPSQTAYVDGLGFIPIAPGDTPKEAIAAALAKTQSTTVKVAVPGPLAGSADPGMITVEVPSNVSPDSLRDLALAMARESVQRADADLRERVTGHLVASLLWWLVPICGLYVGGVGVAWVREGFRRQSTS